MGALSLRGCCCLLFASLFSSYVGIREAKREPRELPAMLLLGPGVPGESAACSLRQEGSRQCMPFKNDTVGEENWRQQKLVQTDWVQDGGRFDFW